MASDPPALSVIIPTLNEAARLPALLNGLAGQRAVELQIIIADGGSSDGTQQLARQHGVLLVESGPGRGGQMNRGAALASHPWLLFLHADSALSSAEQLAASISVLRAAEQQAGHARLAGHYRIRFERTTPGRDLAYRYYEEKSALNRAECTNGDQGLLLRRGFFIELGGFDESLWFLEDQRLAEKIRREGDWITLPGELVTSARRFEQEGLARRMLLSALIMNFHAMGLTEFFQRADGIYLSQGRTGKLQLAPFFNLIARMNREAGGRVSRQRWLATGGYLAAHAWQVFFWLDLALEYRFGTRRRFLPFYDRRLKPLAGQRPVQLLLAGLAWICFSASRLWLLREGVRLSDQPRRPESPP